MESYQNMNRNELLRKLQQHQKYSGTTQKNIGENKTISDLRKELTELDNSEQTNYIINGKNYTIDKLIEIINFYESKHVPQLNDDIINYIYNNVDDIDSIINICTINKAARTQCSKKSFWVRIFNNYNIDMPTDEYNTAQEWIYYIQKQIKIKEYINIIKNKKSLTFKSNSNDSIILNIFDQYKNIIQDYYDKKNNSIVLTFSSSTKNNNIFYCDVSYHKKLIIYRLNIKQLTTILYDLYNNKLIY